MFSIPELKLVDRKHATSWILIFTVKDVYSDHAHEEMTVLKVVLSASSQQRFIALRSVQAPKNVEHITTD